MKNIIWIAIAIMQLGFLQAQSLIDTNQIFMDSVKTYVQASITPENSRIKTDIYPIRYHDGMDVFLEFNKNENGIFIAYENRRTEEVYEHFVAKHILTYTLEDLNLSSDYNFSFHEVLSDLSIATQKEPTILTSKFSDRIVLSLAMYQQMEYWTNYEKDLPLREKLFYLKETGVAEEILISFAQQFFHETNFSLKQDWSFDAKINSLFDGSKKDGEVFNGSCNCAYLTHNAVFGPGDYDLQTGVSDPTYEDYVSYVPDFHYTLFKEAGPAHYKGLFMKDKNGGMSYETSSLGVNNPNYTMSPSFVKHAYNLVCIGDWETPTCECTKIIAIDKLYAARLTAYAPDKNFFWSDGSQAAVEEFATLIVNNAEYGTRVLDANRARVRDACETTWNPEWFENLFELAGDVLGVVISLKTDTSGLDSLTTYGNNISQVGQSLINLVSTPFVNETGSCTPVRSDVTLLSGKQFWILKSNQPTDLIMASYTYLGSRGYGSWETSAISESGYSLATVLQSQAGVKPGVNDCCTDRVGHWNADAITDYPLALHNYVNYAESYLGLFGPWNGITYDVLGNPIFQGNGGYFVYDDLMMKDCAETIPDVYKTDGDSFLNSADISDFEFSLSPNPTNNYLNINIFSNNNANLDISIYAMSGEKIETIYYGSTIGLQGLQWESKGKNLSVGNYFVTITDENGNKEVKQFIYKK